MLFYTALTQSSQSKIISSLGYLYVTDILRRAEGLIDNKEDHTSGLTGQAMEEDIEWWESIRKLIDHRIR